MNYSKAKQGVDDETATWKEGERQQRDLNEGGLTISLHLNRPVGRRTDVFPAFDDSASRKQRFLE